MCFINSRDIPKLFVLFILFLNSFSEGLVLRAYISQFGLHGEIEFTKKNESLISIRTNLKPSLQYPNQIYKWAIHEYPVDYRDVSNNRCSDDKLGNEVFDFTEELGYLIIPGKDHAEFESKNSLTGPKGVWGRSLVLKTADHNGVICASILSTDKLNEKYAVAKFDAPIAGDLTFRWIEDTATNEIDSYLEADLYHIKAPNDKSEYTEHKWKLFITDIYNSDRSNHEDNCKTLNIVFDPDNSEEGLRVGDLDNRLGLIKVAKEGNVKKMRKLYKDEVINMLKSDMESTKRSLYVVVYDNRFPDTFLSCTKLRTIEPKYTKTLINMDGVKGEVEFSQRSPNDPTWANFQLSSSDGEYEANLRYAGSMVTYVIKELPQKLVDPDKYKEICNTTGNIFNPTNVDKKNTPPPGLGTQDQYPVGDLLGKYKDRTEYLNHKYLLPGLANELSGQYWDVYLPLFGRHSVVHRSVVLERREPKQPICGTILLYEHDTKYQTLMSSAEVIYRYPLAGRIVIRQPLGRPWEDSTIIVEGLVHADGSNVNNTIEHRWAIHEKPPGADYYNWTARCLSAGKVYDPYGVAFDMRHPEQYCSEDLVGMCRIGDLTSRHGMFTIAGRKSDSARLTRRLVTDTVVALSGKRSVMGKSLVIYDDHGPVARGERMACSIISGLHKRKAVVRDWFGNGESVNLKGKLEMTQQSEYDVTNVQVTLDGLEDITTYSIHQVPVERDLEFPCERTTLYDTFNPFHVNALQEPEPTKGTADQYILGDLGQKHGLLEGRKSYATFYNETQLSLFGLYSILGRSVILYKKNMKKDQNWACSTIERGYSPTEGREIRGMASFHHPGGFAYGYIRMSQLIHNDGSRSDTVIEVKLRHPGVNDRNLTRNHGWAIFVNPVGVDAAVKFQAARCVAGGYRWNPYFTQLADPLNHDLYSQECGADNPLRCEVGDLTSRLGTIDLGAERQVFIDSNIPLEAPRAWDSAMGKSIVILGPERSGDRFACANLEPDHDIVKSVKLMKPPRFVLTTFLHDIRRVMGIPPWMMLVDSRNTKILHGGACIQFLLHFTGPHANKIELDFARLLASGRLDSPSIFIPGFIDTKRKKTTSYRECGNVDPNEKKKKSFFSSLSIYSGSQLSTSLAPHLALFCILTRLLL